MGCPDEKTRDREMIDAIRNVQQENSYRTGSPRVHKELKKKGHVIGRNKVARGWAYLCVIIDLYSRLGGRMVFV